LSLLNRLLRMPIPVTFLSYLVQPLVFFVLLLFRKKTSRTQSTKKKILFIFFMIGTRILEASFTEGIMKPMTTRCIAM
jgi:hypothetical protein